jgi:hypothetical protein
MRNLTFLTFYTTRYYCKTIEYAGCKSRTGVPLKHILVLIIVICSSAAFGGAGDKNLVCKYSASNAKGLAEYAIQTHRPKKLEDLLKAGCIKATDSTEDGVPFVVAALDLEQGPIENPAQTKVLDVLLRYGADPNVSFRFEGGQTTATLIADWNGKPRQLKALVAHGGQPHGLICQSGKSGVKCRKSDEVEEPDSFCTSLSKCEGSYFTKIKYSPDGP